MKDDEKLQVLVARPRLPSYVRWAIAAVLMVTIILPWKQGGFETWGVVNGVSAMLWYIYSNMLEKAAIEGFNNASHMHAYLKHLMEDKKDTPNDKDE